MSRHAYSPEVLREVARVVEEALPEEACGALFGPEEGPFVTRAVRIPNVHPGPRTRAFAFDDLAHLAALKEAEQRGEREKALFHSHPGGEPVLSPADLAGLVCGGAPLFPGVDVVVVGTRAGRAPLVRIYEITPVGEATVAQELSLSEDPSRP